MVNGAPGQSARTPGSSLGSTRIIALMNQKGGVGKTTSTANLGAALALAGRRTLLVDLDPQAHLTLHVGLDPHQLTCTMYELLTDEQVQGAEAIEEVTQNLAIVPAQVNLAGVETELAAKMVTGVAQRILDRKLAPYLSQSGTEFVLIDCPPSLGLLTINALTCAREILVPMQAHFLALQGLSKLLETVQLIQQSFNPLLKVTGILLCMHENQTLLAQEVMADLRGFLASASDQDVPWKGAQVLEPAVRRNIKLAECPSFGKTIFDYEPTCRGARDYQQLAANLMGGDTGDTGNAGVTVTVERADVYKADDGDELRIRIVGTTIVPPVNQNQPASQQASG